jgi:hypothetical protein
MLLALLHRWMRRPNNLPHLPLRSRRHPWLLERLEDRAVPAIAYATAQGPGHAGPSTAVKVWSETGTLITEIPEVFPGSTGGCYVAVGDVTGDGVNDVVVAAGKSNGSDASVGAPVVLYDGAGLLVGQQRELRRFQAYPAQTVNTPNGTVTINAHLGGATVAVGDTDGDGKGDIITGAADGQGTKQIGPHVKVFSGADNTILAQWFAYENPSLPPSERFFGGGLFVAAADLGGDNGGVPGGRNGKAEILTGVGPGGGSHIKVFDTHTNPGRVDQIASFFAYNVSFKGGVTVSAGFVTNNRDSDGFLYADIVATPGPGPLDPNAAPGTAGANAPPTEVFRLRDGNNPGADFSLNNLTGVALFLYYPSATFNPFPNAFLGGLNSATADLNGDTLDDMLFVPGPQGLPQVQAFAGQSLVETVPPAPSPTFTPAAITTGFPYFAYTPVFLNPPTNTQANPDVITGIFIG